MKGLVRGAGVMLAISLAPGSACMEMGPEYGIEVDSTIDIAHARRAVTAANGLMFNGLAPNGIMFNGIMFNGIMFNGTTLDGLDLGDATLDGMALDAAQESDFIAVLAYAAECALSADQSAVVFASDGAAITLAGALGLAPAWRDGPLGNDGERRVSACLAARANALEQTVVISLRTPDMLVSQQERAVFSTHEGVFWGNLFADQSYIYACVVQGGGIAGRVCAQSADCGFTFMGDCNDVCAFDASLGQYTDCMLPDGSTRTSDVVNTFLSLGHQTSYGDSNICMIEKDGSANHGTVACWGDNTYGQLADGTTQSNSTPIPVSELGNDNAEISATSHICARKHDGSLLCWGRNDAGQVGNGTVEDQHTPVYITGDVTQVTAGLSHTCARKADSTVWCWGSNQFGQVGCGSVERVITTPQQVDIHAARLSSSTNAYHTCAIDLAGDLYCWGKLGVDDISRAMNTPVRVAEDESGAPFGDLTDVCTARDFTCARKADGTPWCWGAAEAVSTSQPRQLAFADTTLTAAPEGISCGESFMCVVAADSTVWCMGKNDYGQLGYDTGGAASPALHQVPGLDGVTFVNAARTHTCATRVDGTAWCWGTDPGRTGGTLTKPLFPDVSLTLQPVQIALP